MGKDSCAIKYIISFEAYQKRKKMSIEKKVIKMGASKRNTV